MENSISGFIGNFETITGVVLTFVFVGLLLIETCFPLRQAKRPKRRRFAINGAVTGLAVAVGGYIVTPVAVTLSAWSAETTFGLLRAVPLPPPAEFIAGFLLMDLTFYYWHRANHVFPLFWRFHNVHHVDPDLDVSTSLRFHCGEVLYASLFRGFQVYLLGISLFTYLVYELIFQCATLFHHSNVRLPIEVERVLNKIFVTPRMHGIHHSIVKEETNSNYSVIFSWWDFLHCTRTLNVKQAEIVIGVPAYTQPEDNRLLAILVLPFCKQKEYWCLPDGKRPKRNFTKESKGILLP
jgi:sterol desaturase/sphingolipid hydroxylase (fatty acid hydroxylase superfamily)